MNLLKLLLALSLAFLIGYSIYGISVVTANESKLADTYECLNYTMLLEQLTPLWKQQSKLENRKQTKVIVHKLAKVNEQINTLSPSYLNRGMLCMSQSQ